MRRVEWLNRHMEGMSLRDWFAGMALQGLLSSDYYSEKARRDEGWKDIALMAYLNADAMLAERSKCTPTV